MSSSGRPSSTLFMFIHCHVVVAVLVFRIRATRSSTGSTSFADCGLDPLNSTEAALDRHGHLCGPFSPRQRKAVIFHLGSFFIATLLQCLTRNTRVMG
jgi:hypothetical protein